MRLLKETTPPLEVAVVVLLEAKPCGPLATMAVTRSLLSPASGLPKRSNHSTWRGGLMAAPAVVLPGSTAKLSWLGASGLMVKLLELGLVRPPLVPAWRV